MSYSKKTNLLNPQVAWVKKSILYMLNRFLLDNWQIIILIIRQIIILKCLNKV